MPLIHSKKPAALRKNIATEVKAGKPVKQAVAIGYSEQREAEKRKKMAAGGEVKAPETVEDITKKLQVSNMTRKLLGKRPDKDELRGVNQIRTEDRVWDVRDNESGPDYEDTDARDQYDQKLDAAEEAVAQGGKLDNEGYAKGGEVTDHDSEIHDMLGQEMMDAFHSKDHKRIMSGIEALVLSMLNKNHKE